MICISEFGYKILSIQAASIYECNLGVRDNLDSQKSMLTNSLFLDFLVENGLRIHNDESTRDVIVIRFGYGSRSYQEELKHLNNMKARAAPEDEEKVSKLIERAKANKDVFDKKSKQELRTLFYRDGVEVTYHTHNKSGEVIRSETIKYRMLYRTPGKAKKGECTFICDRLYKKAREFLYMGIQLPDEDAMITEIGAYSSLVTSTLVGRVMIKPEEILILKDFKSYMTRPVISIELDDENHCHAVHRDDYKLSNEIFDGQALIDTSIFPSWGDGYVLLRHHMTKAAAFHARIQDFFKDHFGDGYDSAEVVDMWGNKHLAKDIKLITTNNAVKWPKFGVSFEYWSDWVRKNGCLFSIVKTAHPSKLGDVQRMSYQMVNSLDISTIDSVMKTTDAYLVSLQKDNSEFLKYLEKNKNFSNDFEVLIALCEHNPKFVQSKYFRERKMTIINSYVMNLKSGKLIQNADNLVLVGNPYAMLMHSVGLNPEDDPTFSTEDDAIQCYTGRFDDGEYLAEFRNPFNSRNNLGYLHNHYHEYFERYFDFGKQIVAVNVIHTDFCDRNNGSDFDSDTIYTTNQPDIVKHAKMCVKNYPTIVNNIPKSSNHYHNTPENFALIDNILARSQLMIGLSSNLAQICLSYTYNFDDQKYDDYVCTLSVLAQASIDNAKRTYACDIASEVEAIKQDMNIGKNGYPEFWQIIRPEFKAVKHTKDGDIQLINSDLKCPMNALYHYRPRKNRSSAHTIPTEDFFIRYENRPKKRVCKKVEELIQKYAIDLNKYNRGEISGEESFMILENRFDEMISDIRNVHISTNYLGLMSYLIEQAFTSKVPNGNGKIYKNKAMLLKVLYEVNTKQFLSCFVKAP